MSTFDLTERVNAIRAAAEKAKCLIDGTAAHEVASIYVPPGSPAITTQTHEIWEKARRAKLVVHDAAEAEISDVYTQFDEAKRKERKRHARK